MEHNVSLSKWSADNDLLARLIFSRRPASNKVADDGCCEHHFQRRRKLFDGTAQRAASQVMDAPTASPEQNYAGDANFVRTEMLMTVVLGVMCVALFFLLMFLFVNTWPALVNYYRRLVCVNNKLVERRIATVRVWTISKTVVDHEHCRALQRSRSESTSTDTKESCEMHDACGNESSSLESNKVQSCGVCFEPFRVNEEVSLSSTSVCHHAYHPRCLEPWLLSHIDCPVCRRIYMLVDGLPQPIPHKTLKALAREQKIRKRSTYFCIQDGLVTENDTSTLRKSDAHETQLDDNNEMIETPTMKETFESETGEVGEERHHVVVRTSLIDSDDHDATFGSRPGGQLMLPFRRIGAGTGDANTSTFCETNDVNNNKDILTKESAETALTSVCSMSSDV